MPMYRVREVHNKHANQEIKKHEKKVKLTNTSKQKVNGRRGYTPLVNGGIGKTRGTRSHLPKPAAPNSTLMRWQGARSPCRARATFFFFRARCWGERHRGARGVKKIPPLDHMFAGHVHATLLILCSIPPRDHHFPSF